MHNCPVIVHIVYLLVNFSPLLVNLLFLAHNQPFGVIPVQSLLVSSVSQLICIVIWPVLFHPCVHSQFKSCVPYCLIINIIYSEHFFFFRIFVLFFVFIGLLLFLCKNDFLSFVLFLRGVIPLITECFLFLN